MSRFRFTIFSAAVDLVLINVSIVAAFFIRFGGVPPAFNFSAYLVLLPIVALAYLFAGWVYGLYEPERVDSPWSVARASFAAVTLGTLLVAAAAFFGGTATAAYSRWTFVFSWAIGIVALAAWRIAFLRWGTIRWPEQRTLIVGIGKTAADLGRSLQERQKWGWSLIGYVPAAGRTQPYSPAMQILGDAQDLAPTIAQYGVNRVIIAAPVDLRDIIEQLVLDESLDITIDVVPELYEIFFGTIDSIVGDVPLMRVVTARRPRYERALKRAVDLAGAAALTVVLSPVWLLAALAVLLDDGAPVLYGQERVGRGQRTFTIYKFRTMVRDAEAQSGPVLATDDDPRVTRVGRVLRRVRIDELPQLINIIQGDMSFIGPRPERPEFVSQHLQTIPGYAERFRIKPGITGLAQVNGGYATTPERKLKYDLVYLYNQSLAMDFQVFVETLKVVLTGRGAR